MHANVAPSIIIRLLFSLLLCFPLLAAPAEKTVIVGFHGAIGESERQLITRKGGTIEHEFELIYALLAKLPDRAIPELRIHPGIDYIEEDKPLPPPSPLPVENPAWSNVAASVDEYQRSWGVQRISAGSAHSQGITGAGVKIAVIDTGIDYNHPELKGNYRGGYDFVNNDDDPVDDSLRGHGTLVAGIIAARVNGQGVVGVAPEASLYALKIMDSNGASSIGRMVAALQWAVDHDIDIVNISMGGPGNGILKRACDAAYQAGVLIIAAAGNSERGVVDYPAAYESVIAVGATNRRDNATFYTARGREVELSAPGTAIYSTKPNGSYGVVSGTSQAAPHAAGVAALILSAGVGDLNRDGVTDNKDLRLKLLSASHDSGEPGRDDLYGYGILDVNGMFTPRPIQLPDLRLSVRSAPEPVLPGNWLDYPITVQNGGMAEATETKLLLTIPTDATLSGESCAPAGAKNADERNGATKQLECILGTLRGKGGLRTIDIDIMAPPDSKSDFSIEALATTYLERNAADNASGKRIISINEPPVAKTVAMEAAVNTAVRIDNLLESVSDPNNDALSITGSSPTSRAGGTVVHSAGDAVIYTPPTDYIGSDSFTYLVSDGYNEPVRGTVTVSVKARLAVDIETSPEPLHPGDEITFTVTVSNPAPVDLDDIGIILSFVQGASEVEILSLGNSCRKPQADTLYCSLGKLGKNGAAKQIALKIKATAAAAIQVNGDISGANNLARGSANKALMVTPPPNQNPVAQNDRRATRENQPLTLTDLLENDSDPDGDTLRIDSVTETSSKGGSVVLSGSGAITYTPPREFSGEDRFRYNITDGNGGTASATVIITLRAGADEPSLPKSPSQREAASESPGGGSSGVWTLLLLMFYLLKRTETGPATKRRD